VAKDEVIVIGALLLVFGFLGYVVPIAEFGSVTDLDNLCSSGLGQLGQAFNDQARENCRIAGISSKLVYMMMGMGTILVIIGAAIPSKKNTMFICGECNIALSTEAALYNHNNSKEHIEKISHMSNNEKKVEYKKKKQIPIRERFRQSPTLQGTLIGIIAIVIFWGVFDAIYSQTFMMGNDALSPDVLQGDLMHYQRIPFNEIKEGDIIAFVPSENEEFSTKVGIIRKTFSENEFFVQTSNNANLSDITNVFDNDYIGKITSITSQGGIILTVYRPPISLLMTIILFVSPIIILKIRKKF
jgi:hypothetical protein